VPDVRFKDVCIDVTDHRDRPTAVAAFWGLALGQPVVPHDDGSFHLDPADGTPPERRVWINVVPEAITVKSRVHIDVRVAGGDPQTLLDAGGRLVRPPDDEISWHVLHDPDGVALCVFPPHPAAPDALGPFELVVDTPDPEAIAAWWAARTGGTVGRRDGAPFTWVEGAAGFPYMFWVFHLVPEAKATKNRVHWDVTLADATIDLLVAAGATLLRERDEEIDWWVLADPDGNEFCAFEPR
jgi:hypothetical protein